MKKTPQEIAAETTVDIMEAMVSLKPPYRRNFIETLVLSAMKDVTCALLKEREKLIQENEALARYVGNQKFTSDFKTADEMRLALNKARAEAAGLQAVLDDC